MADKWHTMKYHEINRKGFVIVGDRLLYSRREHKLYVTREDLRKFPSTVHYKEV